MRKNYSPDRHEIAIASHSAVRSLSRAIIAMVAIGGLAACSADQNHPERAREPAAPDARDRLHCPSFVYVSDSSGVHQLWQLPAALTSRLTLTDAIDKDPHSAAGHLVFASSRDGDEEIYMGRNDLSGLKRLTTSAGEDEQPRLSPDGVAYRLRQLSLGLRRASGSWTRRARTRRRSRPARRAMFPRTPHRGAPTARSSCTRPRGRDASQVFVISADGGTPVQLSTRNERRVQPRRGARTASQIYFVSVMGAPSLRAVTVATGETSDWVYDGAGMGQPTCASSGCIRGRGRVRQQRQTSSRSRQDASVTTVVGTPANETSPTVLVQ